MMKYVPSKGPEEEAVLVSFRGTRWSQTNAMSSSEDAEEHHTSDGYSAERDIIVWERQCVVTLHYSNVP